MPARHIEFDKTVYSDAGLSAPLVGSIASHSSTKIPKGVFLDSDTYTITCNNSVDQLLYSVTFDYPDDTEVVGGYIHIKSEAFA
jgi:hypothetical protein